MAPSAARAISISASSEAVRPMPPSTTISRSTITSMEMRWKSNRWQRERIVAGSRWGSVVARMNTAWAGGSSRVFRRALNAPVDSMCTSSMMYTLYRVTAGGYLIFSRRSRISSTPLLLAASISTTSMLVSCFSIRQTSHSPQGSPSRGFRQLMARDSTFAALVLPVPRVPQNR